MQDPALAPNALRDPGYSVDALRHEEAERYKERADRERQIIRSLDHIRNLLMLIAALLAYIGWRLTN